MQVLPIELDRAGDVAYGDDLCQKLEDGDILLLLSTPFLPADPDAEFLRTQRQSRGRTHKNISYKPNLRQVTGTVETSQADSARIRSILGAYSEGALSFLAELLPRYAARWKVDYASFRPFEEQGRDLPLRRRNDLMHVDAFPTRPIHGDRILRLFTNLHSHQDRVWITADSFSQLAQRYAPAVGLQNLFSPSAQMRRRVGRLARMIGLGMPDRSPYDEFMLRLHDYLKADSEFQEKGVRHEWAFAPGASWISFTDQVAHAARSGQFALEQTCIVPLTALIEPERAPISLLERLAGRPLA